MRYYAKLFYSEEDKGYIAIIPDLPGSSAFGSTREKALKEIKIVEKMWLEVADKEGREIPAPSIFYENEAMMLNPLYINMITDTNIKYMSKKENNEITAILDCMTKEDLSHGGELEF